MPYVRTELIDGLVAGWRASGAPAALVPTLNGRRGNPVVISRSLRAVIEGLSGDVGAGSTLGKRLDVLEWPTTDPAVVQDIDTREELAKRQS
jgi:molybdenum cofactor cytidylyltransferase